MAYDYSLLMGRIVTYFKTQKCFADAMGISEHSLSKKMNGKFPWKQSEIEKACQLLEIDKNDIGSYFFNLKVQYA